MFVSNARRVRVQGRIMLQLEIDGKTALLSADQKRTIFEEAGAVFLGADFEDDYAVDLPADPGQGRPATTLYGFTDNSEVARLYREFLADADAGRLA